ncbi:MAG: pyridoxamine 5'-phosphate oxidase family protein [Burkholderiaceae bacterium]|nr:pyridoxamine 5'-phosphate oxidase family protein [Burkholderiaceae bacterium]
MTDATHTHQPSFHEGERALQARVNPQMQQRLAELGPQIIRDHMPEQHRDFFEQLPFVIAGSVDATGQPWASVLAGAPGFVESPDAQSLLIRAQPLAHDPLKRNLAAGKSVALLGIEPHTRRRNRMNGVVEGVDEDGVAVRVSQSFGNCPKYIQARRAEYTGSAPAAVLHEGPMLDEAARRMIRTADTFFIATTYPQPDAGTPSHGVDVSHRGGKPGFVRVDDDGTLTAPDFAGNQFFNTLGNLSLEPRAGLLFIDFETGDLLYLAVRASIIWDGPELALFEGAQRLVRFAVTAMRRVEAGLPVRFGEPQLSPVLRTTGEWPAGSGRLA